MPDNRHSFHFDRPAQNATALAPAAYQLANNQYAINVGASVRQLPAAVNSAVVEGHWEKLAGPASSERVSMATTAQSDAQQRSGLQNKNGRDEPTVHEVRPQSAVATAKVYGWQLGRGIIEKVDKASGEIYYWSEMRQQ